MMSCYARVYICNSFYSEVLRRCGCAGRHLLMYSFLVSLCWYQHAATCNMTHKQVKGLAAAGTSLHNVDLGRQQSLKDQTDRLPASGASCGTMTLQHTTLTTVHTTLPLQTGQHIGCENCPRLANRLDSFAFTTQAPARVLPAAAAVTRNTAAPSHILRLLCPKIRCYIRSLHPSIRRETLLQPAAS